MLDDNHDKEMARNRILAVILITVAMLIFLWMEKDRRPPVERQPAPSPSQAQQQPPRDPALEDAQDHAEEPGRYALPEPPAADAVIEDAVLANDSLRLVFTPVGARLKEAYLLIDEEAGDVIQLVPRSDRSDIHGPYPLALDFADPDLGDRLNNRVFQWEPAGGGHAGTFSLTLDNKQTGAPAVTIRKVYRLDPEHPYVLDAQILYENHEDAAHRLAYTDEPALSLLWQPDIATGEESRYMRQAFVWLEEGQYNYVETAKLPKAEDKAISRDPAWVALRSAYFLVAMRPQFEAVRGALTGQTEDLEMRLTREGVTVQPGETHQTDFEIYLGPNEDSALAAAWPTLPQARRFFQSDTWAFMDWFSKLLLGMLNWFYAIVPNYGLAIIVLTIIVRMALYPLTLKSMRSMKKMQAVAPQMQEIREKHKDDPAEMQKAMGQLYKEYGVNPLGGCLPMLLQMPVFFALFRMLGSAFELRGANFFLWIGDLSQPDRLVELPFMEAVPFIGGFITAVNVLPILMGVAMFAQQKFAPTTAVQTPQQKTMMTLMPVIFTAICYNMAAGLSLYILTSTLLGMAQQKLIPAGDVEAAPKKKRPAAPKKKQHFYDAAQQRKRQMKKEQQKAKRQSGSSAPSKGAPKGGSSAKD